MNSIQDIIQDIRDGKMVIMVDDENRENEGDLILAADFVTAQAINFMAVEARGLICAALDSAQIRRLGLPQMVKDDVNHSPNKTAFTVSIEAASGVSTGISAADRAHTIRVAASPLSTSADIIVPGHVFPIRAQDGGVLKRAGHTEASVDLARLAGLLPAAVICEVMNLDGTMARTEQLKAFAQKHNLKIGTIEDLIKYRLENESFVEQKVNGAVIETLGRDYRVHTFINRLDGREHLALVKGDLKSSEPMLVRVQVQNSLLDVFSTASGSPRDQLLKSLEIIDREGRGVLVYLTDDNMNISANGDQRNYGVGAQILHALGLKKIKLISSHPAKRAGLAGFGIEIVDSVNPSSSSRANVNVNLSVSQSEPHV